MHTRAGAKLLTASVFAQVSVFAATLAVTPHLSPRDFALYGAVFGLASITNSFNTLGIEFRLPTVSGNRLRLMLRSGRDALLGFLLIEFMICAGLTIFGHSTLAALVVGSSLAAAALGAQQLCTYLALREGHTSFLTHSRVVQGLVNAALIVTLCNSLASGALALVGAWILSVCAGTLSALRTWRPAALRNLRMVGRNWAIVRTEIGSQPFARLLSGVSTNLPLVVLPVLVSVGLAGSWSLFARLLGAGVTASVAAVQPLYYSEAARMVRNKEFARAHLWHRKWSTGLMVVAVPGFSLAAIGIAVGLPILGQQWHSLADVAAPAAAYWGIQFVGVPLAQTLLLIPLTRLQFIWETGRFCCTLAALALGIVVGGTPSIWGWAASAMLPFAVLIPLQRHQLKLMSLQGHR